MVLCMIILGLDIPGQNILVASRELVHTFEKYGLPCVGVFSRFGKISNYGVVRITDGKIDEINGEADVRGPRELCSLWEVCISQEYQADNGKYPATKFGSAIDRMLNHIIQDRFKGCKAGPYGNVR